MFYLSTYHSECQNMWKRRFRQPALIFRVLISVQNTQRICVHALVLYLTVCFIRLLVAVQKWYEITDMMWWRLTVWALTQCYDATSALYQRIKTEEGVSLPKYFLRWLRSFIDNEVKGNVQSRENCYLENEWELCIQKNEITFLLMFNRRGSEGWFIHGYKHQ